MKKTMRVIVLGLALFSIEYVLLLTCYLIEGFMFGRIPKEIVKSAFRHTNEISLARFAFYFIFWVILFYNLYGKLEIKHQMLKLAVLNCGLYVMISAIMIAFFPFSIEFFRRSFFFYLVLGTFLSPFVLFKMWPMRKEDMLSQ